MKEKCDRILGQLGSGQLTDLISVPRDGTENCLPSRPYRKWVAAPVFPPAAPQGWLISMWAPVHKCWSCGPGLRSRTFWYFVWCLVLAGLVIIVLACTLIPRMYLAPRIEYVAVFPATVQTTAANDGFSRLDFTLEANRAATIYYTVTAATKVAPSVQSVIDTATAASTSSFIHSTVACGEVYVPRKHQNFTFSISSGVATKECADYRQLIQDTSDSWARVHKCSRCPELASNTAYQARV